MFRGFCISERSQRSFPRIRGDVPSACRRRWCFGWFSPHTRGCSHPCGNHEKHPKVFPAYAGMFRSRTAWIRAAISFPRIRGDVPFRGNGAIPAARFSPHTRGCSALPCPVLQALSVFPAYAGMFLVFARAQSFTTCFPRIRGDVPGLSLGEWHTPVFSPHTRGCSST